MEYPETTRHPAHGISASRCRSPRRNRYPKPRLVLVKQLLWQFLRKFR
jgi:hypothetical protein